MKTQLVIGASGQVGQHLAEAVASTGSVAVGTYRTTAITGGRCLDITDCAATTALLKQVQPAVVYLPASATHVDYCETHPRETAVTNVQGVANVVEAARVAGAKVVYFSSDYVFDGRAGPYREDDPVNPLSEYGKQKVLAEGIVRAGTDDFIIVRTAGVYGPEHQRKNFIYRLLRTLRAGDVLETPEDQIGSPTYAPNLAQAVVELARSGARGVYHVAGPERVSRYEFGREVARVFVLDERLIRPVTTEALRQPAPRPLNGGLVSAKAIGLTKVDLVGYRQGLRRMADEIKSCTTP